MANLLTGDYEAVLQVSGDTMNRLLASMHQNAGANPANPSFPHSTGVRLGDVVMVGGVQGTAWVQVGAPRMQFQNRVTDRFDLEVGLRIRYRPDDGTEPLAPYIHGSLRATYMLEDIDPNCPGWRKLASQYLWIRVVPESVSFTGTVGDDELLGFPIDPDAILAAVNEQLMVLLEYAFEPAPHPVQSGFRKGAFISINQDFGEVDEGGPVLAGVLPAVPLGGSAVLIPVGVTQDPQLSDIFSLENVLLAQRDFGLAVNVETIMGLIEPALNDIGAYTQTFTVSGDFGSTVYHAFVSSASAQWQPHGSYAVIEVDVTGGAHTNSVLPDISFSVTQRFQTDFDGGSETVRLWAAGNSVSTTAALPKSILHSIGQTIAQTVESKSEAAAANAQPALDQFTSGVASMVTQLQTIDAQADAHLDDGVFHLSGVVLRGWVAVAPRHHPVVKFTKIDGDTFSALDSWIPGGRIDRLDWSWSWGDFGGDPGSATYADRYVLRRPPALHGSKFGAYRGPLPLPGLDGAGTVCLMIEGVVVDPVTGQLMPVRTAAKCTRYGYIDIFRISDGRLLVKPWAAARRAEPTHADSDRGLLDVTAVGRPSGGSANTLIVYAGEPNPDTFAVTLHDGLTRCTREDAGLLVLVLVPDGALERASDQAAVELRALADRLEAPLVVSEDVDGAWSRAFAIPAGTGAPSWRLLSPDGGTLWMEDGPVEPAELAAVLDRCLYPSVPAQPVPVELDLDARLRDPAWLGSLFQHDHGPSERPHCPPWPGERGAPVKKSFDRAVFIRKEGAGYGDQLRALEDQYGARGADEPGVVVVVDGLSWDEARSTNAGLGDVFTVVGDEGGARARALGVRVWPNTVPLQDDADPMREEEQA